MISRSGNPPFKEKEKEMSLLKRFSVALLALVMATAACVPNQPSPVPNPTAAPTLTPAAAPVSTPTEPPAKLSPLFAPGITSEPLGIVSTQPADKAQEVAVDRTATRIIVQFNHPVVPLVSVAAQKTLPQPLKLSPAVAGDGEWLNTSTFAFTPSQNLSVATTYTVTVGAVKDMLGMDLSGAAWSFRTSSPVISGPTRRPIPSSWPPPCPSASPSTRRWIAPARNRASA